MLEYTTNKAREWFSLATSLDPDNAMAQLYLAHCFHDIRHWDNAVQAYSAVNETNLSRDWPLWRLFKLKEQRAYCVAMSGKRDESIRLFSEYIDELAVLDPKVFFDEVMDIGFDLLKEATQFLDERRLLDRLLMIARKMIEREENVETRRFMIERYGEANFLIDSGAQAIHSDRFGTLLRKNINGDEPLVMIRVANPTPDLDGSARTYFIRVPPEMTTARQAVAWSFGLDENGYNPDLET